MKRKNFFLSLITFVYKGIIPAIILLIDWKLGYWNAPDDWNVPEISMIAMANAFLLLFAIVIISADVREVMKWTKRVAIALFVLAVFWAGFWVFIDRDFSIAKYGILYIPALGLWFLVGVSEEYYVSLKEEIHKKRESS